MVLFFFISQKMPVMNPLRDSSCGNEGHTARETTHTGSLPGDEKRKHCRGSAAFEDPKRKELPDLLFILSGEHASMEQRDTEKPQMRQFLFLRKRGIVPKVHCFQAGGSERRSEQKAWVQISEELPEYYPNRRRNQETSESGRLQIIVTLYGTGFRKRSVECFAASAGCFFKLRLEPGVFVVNLFQHLNELIVMLGVQLEHIPFHILLLIIRVVGPSLLAGFFR